MLIFLSVSNLANTMLHYLGNETLILARQPQMLAIFAMAKKEKKKY